jgi:diguanylate cyclase (GGDEF)-like protein
MLAASVVLVVLSALAARISLVVGPRTRLSTAGAYVVAAALIGGPVVGACAGVAAGAFAIGDAGRRRVAGAAAGAVQGLAVGFVGEQIAQHGVSGAVTAASAGLLTGFALYAAAVVLLGRGLRASWRPIALAWLLPAPLLVVFVYVWQTAPGLASANAAALLLVVAAGNRYRLRLERRLTAERSKARVDALTSAPNRYALAEALKAEHARIRRGGRTAAVCFLDLDRFKTVNDTYGYAAGDRLLVDVHERMRDHLRATDLVFRWGGEEFVVLAPHVERSELADFAERLRLLLAARPFAIDGRPRTITASVGAVLLDDSRPGQDALEAASRLVKKAKLTRNTAVVEPASAAAA